LFILYFFDLLFRDISEIVNSKESFEKKKKSEYISEKSFSWLEDIVSQYLPGFTNKFFEFNSSFISSLTSFSKNNRGLNKISELENDHEISSENSEELPGRKNTKKKMKIIEEGLKLCEVYSY
jgi:hypothetical protein